MVDEPLFPAQETSLERLIKMRYPHILPAVLDLYEKIYKTVPWERDPIRGGYRLMDPDLRFLDEISQLLAADVKPLATELPPAPPERPIEEPLPPVPVEEKVPQDVPLGPPKRRVTTGATADFSALEAKLGGGTMPVAQASKSPKASQPISPLEEKLRTGTTEVDIPVGVPNKAASMAKFEQKKKEIEDARRKVSSDR